jgi:hypothetical protein
MDAISNEADLHWRLRAIDNDTVCTPLLSIHDPGPFGDSNSGPSQSRRNRKDFLCPVQYVYLTPLPLHSHTDLSTVSQLHHVDQQFRS